MYIVRDKKNKKIIHVNPAPLSQKLEPKEVYARFNASRMEIGHWEGGAMPVAFNIDPNGTIVAIETPEETDAASPPSDSGRDVDPASIESKTLSQRVADGDISLLPHQKITGKGPRERIVDKSLYEHIKGGTLELMPDQKMIGKGDSAQIVNKSPADLVKDGIASINEPFDYIDGDTIRQRTLEELVKKKLLKKAAHRKTARALLDQRVEAEIATLYSPGKEMQLLKAYIDWQSEGKPPKDDREKHYLKMQKEIVKIKSQYNTLKKALGKGRKSSGR